MISHVGHLPNPSCCFGGRRREKRGPHSAATRRTPSCPHLNINAHYQPLLRHRTRELPITFPVGRINCPRHSTQQSRGVGSARKTSLQDGYPATRASRSTRRSPGPGQRCGGCLWLCPPSTRRVQLTTDLLSPPPAHTNRQGPPRLAQRRQRERALAARLHSGKVARDHKGIPPGSRRARKRHRMEPSPPLRLPPANSAPSASRSGPSRSYSATSTSCSRKRHSRSLPSSRSRRGHSRSLPRPSTFIRRHRPCRGTIPSRPSPS